MDYNINRRKIRRVSVFDDFHVLDTQTGEMLGFMRDVSLRGMMVVGTSDLVIEQLYHVAIVLPEPVLGENNICLDATCRWHIIDPKLNIHKSGFEFGILNSSIEQALQQIQTEYEFSISESSS